MTNHDAKLLLIIGPTAVGKSSIIEKALADFPKLCDIITYTTRSQRAGESEGNPYHFVTEDQFRKLESQNFFLETANVHGKFYGTPKDQILRASEDGKCIIIDIDVQGAKKLMTQFKGAMTVFLMPPSLDALKERFIKRGITNQEDLDKRLVSAEREMAQAKDFHHIVVNDRLDSAYKAICEIIEGLFKPTR